MKDLDSVTNPAVPLEKRQENAAYIAHSVKLACLDKIDRFDSNAVKQRTLDYLEMCQQDGMKPNIAGYALALGTNRAGLEAMFRDRRIDADTYAAVDAGMTVIENIMVELMLDQKINPVTAIFLLKNHFMGTYQDASQVTVRQERVDVIDTSTLEKKYQSVVDIDYADSENLQPDTKNAV